MKHTHLDKNEIMWRVAEHRKVFCEKNPDSTWFVCAAKGSVNYNLDTEKSDVDTYLITVPSWENILDDTTIGTTFTVGEELCSVIDLRIFIKRLMSSNVGFLEVLYSDYVDVNPKYGALWARLFTMRDDIAFMNPVKAINSMVSIARAELKKISSSKKDKALYHILRMSYMMRRYCAGQNFKLCMTVSDNLADQIIAAKEGEIDWSSYGGIESVARKIVDSMDKLAQETIDGLDDYEAPTLVEFPMRDIEKTLIADNLSLDNK